MARGLGKYFFTSDDRSVVCPKPHRPAAGDPPRWTLARLADSFDSEPSNDHHILLPNIAGESMEQSDPVQSFFCGSPPTRSANPVVLDTRFGEASPLQPVQCITVSGSDNPQSQLDRTRLGLTPAGVRIDGFDCLNCNCSHTRGIPAVA